jgi:hypothetical protein
VKPLSIPHLHDWRKMGVCLINFNNGKDDEGCLKLYNILKWNKVNNTNVLLQQNGGKDEPNIVTIFIKVNK